MADLWVIKSQEWINSRYKSVSGVPTLVVDGITGWGTMFALTRALQHELGVSSLSDTFGPATQAAFVSKVKNIGSTSPSRVIAILQCALWCKGYTGGIEFGKWDTVIPASVSNVRRDAGLSAGSGVGVKLMKSLLTLDAYVRASGGSDLVRAGQQWLNSRYTSRSDFFIVPCDGRFTRDVQQGLMLALQYELGMADGVANGNFGPGTQAGLRANGNLQSGSSDGTAKLVSVFQLALAFNGYNVTRSGTFTSATRTSTLDFQRFLEISQTGNADFGTWAALLVSTGDVARSVSGFDTTTALTPSFAAARYREGYRVVGRYLTVTGKSLAPGELDVIFEAGLKVFPIFQNYNNAPDYFTRALGIDHGRQAAVRARQLGFRGGVPIFFAVDYDAFEREVDALIAPYFEGIAEGLKHSATEVYPVGVYATRHIASRIGEKGLATHIWVSGMSTGYSGNLGYPMPKNWSYNQIQELNEINIDRNAVSAIARPATRADVYAVPSLAGRSRDLFRSLVEQELLAEECISSRNRLLVDQTSRYVLQFLISRKYNNAMWKSYVPAPEFGASESVREALSLSRADYMARAGSPDAAELAGNYTDDRPATPDQAWALEHMAATALGVERWGTHEGLRSMGLGDLGGWGLDLATFWRDCKAAGTASTGEAIGAFVDSRLGHGTNPSSFDRADLIADADGWLVGRNVRAGLPFGPALGVLLRKSPDWRDRLREFVHGRFGAVETRGVIIAAVQRVFLGWPYPQFPVTLFLDGQPLPTRDELVHFSVAVANRLCFLARIP